MIKNNMEIEVSPYSKLSGNKSKQTTASINPAENSRIQLRVLLVLKDIKTPINPPIKVPNIPKKNPIKRMLLSTKSPLKKDMHIKERIC